MSPIGDPFDAFDPFDAGQIGSAPDPDLGPDGDGPGQVTPAPARAACRAVTARRAGPPQR